MANERGNLLDRRKFHMMKSGSPQPPRPYQSVKHVGKKTNDESILLQSGPLNCTCSCRLDLKHDLVWKEKKVEENVCPQPVHHILERKVMLTGRATASERPANIWMLGTAYRKKASLDQRPNMRMMSVGTPADIRCEHPPER